MRPLLTFLLVLSPLIAQPQPSERGRQRIITAIRKEIVTLPYYGVFDWITYRVDGYNVTLMGQVSRPTLKTDAERVVKKIEGVERVANRIEVLPLSPNDDRIRQAVINAIFGHQALTRYAIRGPNAPIHILVKNGEVTLEGVVAIESDRNIAGLQANGVPGVFKVTNNLTVENGTGKASRQ